MRLDGRVENQAQGDEQFVSRRMNGAWQHYPGAHGLEASTSWCFSIQEPDSRRIRRRGALAHSLQQQEEHCCLQAFGKGKGGREVRVLHCHATPSESKSCEGINPLPAPIARYEELVTEDVCAIQVRQDRLPLSAELTGHRGWQIRPGLRRSAKLLLKCSATCRSIAVP